MRPSVDVLIIGGGPAGLSAALVLGRCRRSVLVCDAGNPRNIRSRAMHGFLSRDGIPPPEFLALAREQLKTYPSVALRQLAVESVERDGSSFTALLSTGEEVTARRVLLATGVVDCLPALPRIEEFYGRSVYHCPYCDGWEFADQPIAVYGRGKKAHRLALTLTCWTDKLCVCTDGPHQLSREQEADLARLAIAVREEKIQTLLGQEGRLEAIRFASGNEISCRAIFFATQSVQRSPLGEKLGCELTPRGGIKAVRHEVTTVPGLYAAGDLLRDMQYVVYAAAAGAKAGTGINISLLNEQLERRGIKAKL